MYIRVVVIPNLQACFVIECFFTLKPPPLRQSTRGAPQIDLVSAVPAVGAPLASADGSQQQRSQQQHRQHRSAASIASASRDTAPASSTQRSAIEVQRKSSSYRISQHQRGRSKAASRNSAARSRQPQHAPIRAAQYAFVVLE